MCDKTEKNDNNDVCDKDKFKSCFARSVAVNWQYKQIKSSSDTISLKNINEQCCTSGYIDKKEEPKDVQEKTEVKHELLQEIPIRWRKNTRSASLDESSYHCYSKNIVSKRRTSSIISSTATASCSEIPVENIYNQNKIETLQWQLKETEKSREMYKALMKQVVVFLEKAHTNLELLSSRMNRKISVPKSLSDCNDNNGQKNGICEEYTSSWTSSKKRNIPKQTEIQPDKLSEEAFRLLRTAKSLLSTQEPTLKLTSNPETTSEKPLPTETSPSSDIEFLAQLAKEFAINDSTKSSLSFSPKLILPENEIRISTAFNRKLSLQLNEVREKRGCAERASIVESDCSSPLLGSVVGGGGGGRGGEVGLRSAREKIMVVDGKKKDREKTSYSSAAGSISSVEDESGFSSLTSFQDVGLPLVNSTTTAEEISPRQALLNSMLYTDTPTSSLTTNFSHLEHQDSHSISSMNPSESHHNKESNSDDFKLWQTPQPQAASSNEVKNTDSCPSYSEIHYHKRWNSMPDPKIKTRSLKVLWV